MSQVLMRVFSLDTPEIAINVPVGMILFGYRGSVAHGMYTPRSNPDSIDDVDLMGFAIGEPQHYFGLQEWGSRGTKEFWHGHYDCVWYELRKAVSLLLQGNPNIISSLWMRPCDYIHLEPEGRELIANRNLFVGRHIYNAFAGYAHAQLLKMESREPSDIREYLGLTYELKRRGAHPTDQNLPESLGDHTDCSQWSTDKLLARYRHFTKKGENLGYLGDKRKRLVLEHGYDAKNAAHCIRLLRMCLEFLQTGDFHVYRDTDAQELLDIKAGKWPLATVKSHAEDLFRQAKETRDCSSLPDRPRREEAEQLLIDLVIRFSRRTGAFPGTNETVTCSA